MQLDPHHIHVWPINLSITPVQEKRFLSVLSPDELERVHRIRLLTQKQRTIAARGALRHILAQYLKMAANDIQLAYNEHQKPYLAMAAQQFLHFNLTHSKDQALLAVTRNYPIGIDIEKIESKFNLDIAKRYFSTTENQALAQLPAQEQVLAFFRLWSRKEAMVKAIGMGLSLPLSSFSVSPHDETEMITIGTQRWSLMPIPLYQDFAAAVATSQTVKTISYWRLDADGFTMMQL